MKILKVGGGSSINWGYISEDVAQFLKKEQLILVHGAGAIRDKIATQLNAPTRTIISPSGFPSTHTDKKAIEIFLMVYPGLVNKQIVAKLQSYGVNAVGLSGVDGRLWQAKRKKEILSQEGSKIKVIRDSYTGRVEKINTSLLSLLLDHKYVPVICPPAISEECEIVNTDNDTATAVLAHEMKCKEIIMLFEAPGLLKDHKDESSIIRHIPKNKIDDYLKYAQGRMKKKLLGAKQAFSTGVTKIYWGDGRVPHPISRLLTGEGTIIS